MRKLGEGFRDRHHTLVAIQTTQVKHVPPAAVLRGEAGRINVVRTDVDLLFRYSRLQQQILGKLGQTYITADFLREIQLAIQIERGAIHRTVGRTSLHAALTYCRPVVSQLAALTRAVVDVETRVRAP